LGAIYSTWLPELYLVAFRYVQSEQEAEDVVADCFEKLFLMPITKRHQKFIKDEINLKALLLVMIKNRSLDVIKTKKNRNRILDGLAKYFPKFGLNGSKQTISNENFKSLLSCLPDKEMKVLTLHLEGFNNIEIGIQLAISEKTVANLLSVARKKVKQLWKIFME
jgi:RNA polymerase sigma factor (sigma-70 family)